MKLLNFKSHITVALKKLNQEGFYRMQQNSRFSIVDFACRNFSTLPPPARPFNNPPPPLEKHTDARGLVWKLLRWTNFNEASVKTFFLKNTLYEDFISSLIVS